MVRTQGSPTAVPKDMASWRDKQVCGPLVGLIGGDNLITGVDHKLLADLSVQISV